MDIEIKSALAELELQVKEGKTITKKAPKGSAQKVIPVLVAELTVSGGPPAPAPRSVPVPKGQGKRVQVQGDMASLETLRELNKKVDLSGSREGGEQRPLQLGCDERRDSATCSRRTAAPSPATAAKVDAWSAAHSNGNATPCARAWPRGVDERLPELRRVPRRARRATPRPFREALDARAQEVSRRTERRRRRETA
jgi:hypothetical protein